MLRPGPSAQDTLPLSRVLLSPPLALALAVLGAVTLATVCAPASGMPTITLLAPSNTSALTNNPMLEIRAHIEGLNVSATLNGTASPLDASGNFSVNVTLAEGPNAFLIVALDALNESAFLPFSVELDTVPPAVAVDSPANGTLTNQTNVTLAGHAEPGSRVTVNGYPVTLDSAGIFTHDLALDALFDQTENLLVVRAVDDAGNVAYANVSVIVDVLAPSIALDFDPQMAARIEARIPLSITSILVQGTTDSTDASLTIANISVPLSGLSFSVTVPLIEGLNNISIRAQDAAGNSLQVTLSVIRDTIAPTLNLTSPSSSGFLTNQTTTPIDGYLDSADAVVYIYYTDARGLMQADPVLASFNASSSHWEFHYTLVLNADGYAHVVRVRAQDVAGNAVESLFQYTVDLAPPVLVLDALTVFGTSPPRVWVNGSTDDSTATITINGEAVAVTAQTFSALFDLAASEGDTFFTIIATDAAGNVATEIRTAHFEFPPPPLPAQLHLSMNGSSSLEAPSGVPVFLSLDLQNASEFTVSWYSDSALISLGATATFTFTQGPHAVVARVSNGVSSQNYTFTVVAVAPTPPPPPLPASLNLSANGTPITNVVAGSPVRLAVDLADGSAYDVTWSVDGQPAGSGPSIELALAAGTHTLTANVSNGQATQTYTFTVLVFAPSPPAPPMPASLNLSANGTPISNIVAGSPVRFSVDLANATAYTVTWSVDGQPAGSGPSIELALAAGTHTLTANVSNGQATQTYTFTVVAQAPAAAPSAGPSLLLPVLVAGVAAACVAAYALMRRSRARP